MVRVVLRACRARVWELRGNGFFPGNFGRSGADSSAPWPVPAERRRCTGSPGGDPGGGRSGSAGISRGAARTDLMHANFARGSEDSGVSG